MSLAIFISDTDTVFSAPLSSDDRVVRRQRLELHTCVCAHMSGEREHTGRKKILSTEEAIIQNLGNIEDERAICSNLVRCRLERNAGQLGDLGSDGDIEALLRVKSLL